MGAIRNTVSVLALCAGLIGAGAARAADCDIPADIVLSDGYLVGRELLALPDEALASYIIGYINAVSISVAFGAKAECIEQAHQYIANLGTDAVGTAMRRYIAEDPKRVETPASHLTFQVMYSRCVRVVPKGAAT